MKPRSETKRGTGRLDRSGGVLEWWSADPAHRSIAPSLHHSARSASAFTLVEIAIALAIIGFALVAIIGVLPAGLNVQKDNREDTIIGHDAPYLMEAIRNGAIGFDHLTNYVESIFVSNRFDRVIHTNAPNLTGSSAPNGAIYDGRMTNGQRIVELLTTPKYLPTVQPTVTNLVVARVRAISSPAAEQPNVSEFSFRYLLTAEIVPFTQSLVDTNATNWNAQPPLTDPDEIARRKLKWMEVTDLHMNTTEIRFRLNWPLLPDGRPGPRAQTFRTLVAGERTLGQPLPPQEYGPPTGRITPQKFLAADAPAP